MDLESKIQALREEYASELPERISDIYEYWERFLTNPGDQEALDKLLHICHNLSGTGASFGFTSLSQHANEIERFLRPSGQKRKEIDSQHMLRVSHLITTLNDDCKKAS